MKVLIIGLILMIASSASALEKVGNFSLSTENMSLIGKQRVHTFQTFSAEKDGKTNFAFETSILRIEFDGQKAVALKSSLNDQTGVFFQNSSVNYSFIGNFNAIGEEILVSCELNQDKCTIDYTSPKIDHDGGLPGSDRTNSHDVSSLAEAIERASKHQPILNFNNENEILFEKNILELVFERDPLEEILERANLCERVFIPGGPYGPGGTRCFMDVVL